MARTKKDNAVPNTSAATIGRIVDDATVATERANPRPTADCSPASGLLASRAFAACLHE